MLQGSSIGDPESECLEGAANTAVTVNGQTTVFCFFGSENVKPWSVQVCPKFSVNGSLAAIARPAHRLAIDSNGPAHCANHVGDPAPKNSLE